MNSKEMDRIELISIHIPKTAGTSFYHILKEIYGDRLSISYKRRDIKPLLQNGGLSSTSLQPKTQVLHGHFYYREIQALPAKKVICWLRDPVDRVISNFNFFKDGLQNPTRNPANYERNKHRIDEDLLTYASLPENQNRMSDFLAGLALEDLFFIGRQAHFAEDIQRLARLLSWPDDLVLPTLNKGSLINMVTDDNTRASIEAFNQQDFILYNRALENFISP